MSNKGKIAKQEHGRKAIEIMAWIVEQANTGKAVVLSDDWGGNTLTLALRIHDSAGKLQEESHTHIGNAFGDSGLEELIDSFHSTVIGKGGMSWHTERMHEDGI